MSGKVHARGSCSRTGENSVVKLKYQVAAIAVALSMSAAAAHGAIITYSDADFPDANWSAIEVLDTSPDNSYSFSAGQVLAGGNPGAYRQVINTLGSTTPSSIGSGHFLTGATFDPGVDGTFASVDVSFRGISLNAAAGAMGYGLLAEQDGNFFQVGLGQTLNSTGWQLFSATGLTEGDFTALGAGALDLTNAGSVVSLGVIVRNGTFGLPGAPSVNEGGIDNWSVSVHTAEVAEPGILAVLSVGLAGLGFARNRRRS